MKWFSFFQSNSKKSDINGTIYIGKRSGNKALFAGGVTQSGGELTTMWEVVVKNVQDKKPQITSCLVLGVAGGTVIKLLNKQFPKLKITGIELDPVMVKLAKEQFGLTEEKTIIITTDAISWCKKNINKKFDCIIVDLYVGKFNPEKARTSEFLRVIANLLSSGGIVYYNSHYQKTNPKEFEKFEQNCKHYFQNVEQLYEFPLNKLLVLSGKKMKQTKK